MEIWQVVLDALLDTAKILPFLFIVYYLIELLEFKFANKFQNNKFLKGKYSPLFASLVGCVPQCGFSVVSADLYTKKAISIGALISVFIATSDEAFPLMVANLKSAKWLLLLIAIKILFAIVVGYLSIWLYKLCFKKDNLYKLKANENVNTTHKDDAKLKNENKIVLTEEVHSGHNHGENNHNENSYIEINHNENNHDEHSHNEHNHIEHIHDGYNNGEHNEKVETISSHGGCCHHNVDTKSFDWLHPLLHCLKISVFVLVINLIFGFFVHWIGEDALTKFLTKSLYFQPVLAIIIGFIPNCASSVVLTELFIMGGLSFGSLVAGLCVNAGLGVIILLKQNKNVKENIFILLMMSIPSLILGYALNFI